MSWVALVTGVLAVGVLVIYGTLASADFVLGAAIVLTPNLWLAVKVTGHRWVANAALVAVTKYTLSGTGFAVLFALRPDSNALAVFAGSAVALFALPVAVAASKQTTVE